MATAPRQCHSQPSPICRVPTIRSGVVSHRFQFVIRKLAKHRLRGGIAAQPCRRLSVLLVHNAQLSVEPSLHAGCVAHPPFRRQAVRSTSPKLPLPATQFRSPVTRRPPLVKTPRRATSPRRRASAPARQRMRRGSRESATSGSGGAWSWRALYSTESGSRQFRSILSVSARLESWRHSLNHRGAGHERPRAICLSARQERGRGD
jgi:hypothetical protein